MRTFEDLFGVSNFQIHNIANSSHYAVYYIPRAYSHITGKTVPSGSSFIISPPSPAAPGNVFSRSYEFRLLAGSVSGIPLHRSFVVCVCLTYFTLHHALKVHSMLLQIARLHSFLWLTSIVVYIPWNSIHVSFLYKAI